MKRYTAREIFTIPNIIGYVRLLLIPVFCLLYKNGHEDLAAIVVLFSSFTDLFDGMIARKFNQVTELGKILDPVADKLTHAAMALCLAFRYPLMWALLALMAVKEGYMAIMGIIYLKKGQMMNGAMWFGKICTVVFYLSTLVLTFWQNMPRNTAMALMIICGALMLFAFVRYAILCFYMAQNPRTGSFDSIESIKTK